AHEQRQVFQGREVFDDRVLVLLDRLPAPHVGLGGVVGLWITLDVRLADAVGPESTRSGAGDEGVGGRAQALVFHQRAVAYAAAVPVASLHEPVEAPGRVARVRRLLHQLLHRDRAVRAGGVVMDVARHVGPTVVVAVGIRGAYDGGAERGGN